MATRTARTNDAALTAYMAQIDRLQAAVATLKEYAENGVCDVVAPENIQWGHVGSLNSLTSILEEAIATHITMTEV